MSFPFVVIQHWIPAPSRRRRGLAVAPRVQFLVAHDTGNPGSSAMANARYYASTADKESVSAHLFIDDKQIVESVPALTTTRVEKAWHVRYGVPTDDHLFGVDANDAAIGIEYCYGGAIDADEAYKRYVWVLAHLCQTHALSPQLHIAGHFILDPERKTDPVTGLAHSRRTYEQLLRDVVAEHARLTGGPVQIGTEHQVQIRLRTQVRLNLRLGGPSRLSPTTETVPANTLLVAIGRRDDGEPINGNPRWYRTASNLWFWSGGAVQA
jgi:N-acetylmuramoyl-L-alanine amidase